MIVVHHLANSRSQRILWLLEELSVPYEVKRYERMLESNKAPALLMQVHPLGKSPVIQDKDEGILLGESCAIIVYLLRKYGRNQTLSAEGALDDLYYTHYAESTLNPLLVTRRKLLSFSDSAPWYLQPLFRYVLSAYSAMYVNKDVPIHCEMIETHLTNNLWFSSGSDGPTSADYAMIRALEALMAGQVVTPETHPAIGKYVEKVHARPAYQAALRKGGDD